MLEKIECMSLYMVASQCVKQSLCCFLFVCLFFPQKQVKKKRRKKYTTAADLGPSEPDACLWDLSLAGSHHGEVTDITVAVFP